MYTENTDPFPLRATWELDTRRLGRRVLVFARVDSTNTRALDYAGHPDGDGLALLADEQTAGRGQHGRTWSAAPRSSVLLSLLLWPPGRLARPVILTAWAAVSVCAVVREITGATPRIKWPNDVLVGGKKVCGILIEQSRQGDSAATVLGLGLNVTQSQEEFAAAGLPLATSLAASAAGPLDTDAVARRLLRELDEQYDRLLVGDLAGLEGQWQRYLGQLGKEVVLECIHGLYPGRLVELSFGAVVLERPDEPSQTLPPESVLHIHDVSRKGAKAQRQSAE
jgi:BirA family biotin operon repressor/biotin-[acetyl-CoA-carboxylase] ligase